MRHDDRRWVIDRWPSARSYKTKQGRAKIATERQFFKHFLAWHLLHGCECRSDTVGTHARISIVLKRRRSKATHLIIKARLLESSRRFLSFYDVEDRRPRVNERASTEKRAFSIEMHHSKWLYVNSRSFSFFGSGVNTHAVVFVGIRVNTQNYIDEYRH